MESKYELITGDIPDTDKEAPFKIECWHDPFNFINHEMWEDGVFFVACISHPVFHNLECGCEFMYIGLN